MSYRYGVGPLAARLMRIEPGPPAITCDGCGKRREIPGVPPGWFLDGRAAPGWELIRADGTRADYCPECTSEEEDDVRYWTKSWTPITGCSPISPGCDRCWARAMVERLPHLHGHDFLPDMGNDCPGEASERPFEEVAFHPERLRLPRWRKPQIVACCWLGDLFHGDVPSEWIRQVTAEAWNAALHQVLFLTKRPTRMANVGEVLASRGVSVPAHLWFGTSCEDQENANARIPELLRCPGRRWLSLEPLLGPIDLADAAGCTHWDDPVAGIHAVVVGAESGPRRRPIELAWVRSLRDQCRESGVRFLYKQGPDDRGAWSAHPVLDGAGQVNPWAGGDR